jgi:predicted  nucleic acid-binding Zn-ribbon protein
MRIFGYHIPGTRDLPREVELLQQQASSLRDQKADDLKTLRALQDEQYNLQGELSAVRGKIALLKAACSGSPDGHDPNDNDD